MLLETNLHRQHLRHPKDSSTDVFFLDIDRDFTWLIIYRCVVVVVFNDNCRFLVNISY